MNDYHPIEEIEQIRFVQWLEQQGYKYTAIPNGTYTKSWMQKAKNTRMGLRAGFPDLVVIANKHFICVEMKRIGARKATDVQTSWVEALTDAGVYAKVCYGAEEAIAFIKSIIDAEQEISKPDQLESF